MCLGFSERVLLGDAAPRDTGCERRCRRAAGYICIISLLFSRYGSFAVKVGDIRGRNCSLSLCKNDCFLNPVSRLNCKAVKDVTTIDGNSLPVPRLPFTRVAGGHPELRELRELRKLRELRELRECRKLRKLRKRWDAVAGLSGGYQAGLEGLTDQAGPVAPKTRARAKTDMKAENSKARRVRAVIPQAVAELQTRIFEK